jgi:hypothetical protein
MERVSGDSEAIASSTNSCGTALRCLTPKRVSSSGGRLYRDGPSTWKVARLTRSMSQCCTSGMLLVTFGPYRKTNPQNCEDHIGNPGRQQMSGCPNHENYSDHQGHIGPLDVIFGGHDTCLFAITPSLNDHQDALY